LARVVPLLKVAYKGATRVESASALTQAAGTTTDLGELCERTSLLLVRFFEGQGPIVEPEGRIRRIQRSDAPLDLDRVLVRGQSGEALE
jgi:hypothetical protein